MSIIGLKKNQKRMQGTLRFKTLSMALLCCASLAASPVIRKSITVTGPDGSELVLMPHGDEFGVWYTDAEGRVMVQDAQGNFVYGRPDAAVVNRTRAAAQNRIGEMSIHEGSPRIPVILVSFADTSRKRIRRPDLKTVCAERLRAVRWKPETVLPISISPIRATASLHPSLKSSVP